MQTGGLFIMRKSENKHYRIRKIRINNQHDLYEYCDTITLLSNNLYNAVRFRQRQVLTAVKKEADKRTENEKEVLGEVSRTVRYLNELPPKPPTEKNPNPQKKIYSLPDENHFFLSYEFLNHLLYYTQNPDYHAKGLPKQSAQYTIKQCVRDMKSFFAAVRKYKENPDIFTGQPRLPGYHKKGGHTMVIFTNQDAVLYPIDKGYEVKLPLTKKRVPIGYLPEGMKLKEVRILPDNGTYLLSLTLECPNLKIEVKKDTSTRIIAIDFGVRNLMAVTNNCGLPCLLYQGGILKSANQLYNKKIAKIVSQQTLKTKEKFVPNDEFYKVTIKRNDQVSDFMHKVAKHLVLWCVEHRIDTIVLGENTLWKQKADLGKRNNQNFVEIPYQMLKNIMKYLASEKGIHCVSQEESYTSKASFLDQDFIPVYKKGENKTYAFSGKRGVKGCQGLYQTKEGWILNADLNGSANILRKAFPHAFDEYPMPNFSSVNIMIHPDYEKVNELKNKQQDTYGLSHAKSKRLNRKRVA